MATGGGEDASVDVVESKKGSLYIVDDDKQQAPIKILYTSRDLN